MFYSTSQTFLLELRVHPGSHPDIFDPIKQLLSFKTPAKTSSKYNQENIIKPASIIIILQPKVFFGSEELSLIPFRKLSRHPWLHQAVSVLQDSSQDIKTSSKYNLRNWLNPPSFFIILQTKTILDTSLNVILRSLTPSEEPPNELFEDSSQEIQQVDIISRILIIILLSRIF